MALVAVEGVLLQAESGLQELVLLLLLVLAGVMAVLQGLSQGFEALAAATVCGCLVFDQSCTVLLRLLQCEAAALQQLRVVLLPGCQQRQLLLLPLLGLHGCMRHMSLMLAL